MMCRHPEFFGIRALSWSFGVRLLLVSDFFLPQPNAVLNDVDGACGTRHRASVSRAPLVQSKHTHDRWPARAKGAMPRPMTTNHPRTSHAHPPTQVAECGEDSALESTGSEPASNATHAPHKTTVWHASYGLCPSPAPNGFRWQVGLGGGGGGGGGGRHQQEHRPQRPTESSDPTQHAKGRTGDRPGPRKGATTRRNVTQGGGGGCIQKEGTSETAPEAVRQAVGGGCQSGWGRLLSVTNAIEPGPCRQGVSGWA